MSILISALCTSFCPGSGSPSQRNHVESPKKWSLALAPAFPSCTNGSPEMSMIHSSGGIELLKKDAMSSPEILPSKSVKYFQNRKGCFGGLQKPSSHLGQSSVPLPPCNEQFSKVTIPDTLNSICKVLFTPGDPAKPVLINVPFRVISSTHPSPSVSAKKIGMVSSTGTHLAVG